MEGFCRGCLIRYDDPEELLEYTEKNRRLFIYATGLQVKRNDTFTFQLCKDCYLNMKQSCKFKKLCRTSDNKFKTYLSLKDTGDTGDLCTYLKNNDDDLTLRFPNWDGNSTPANQRRDDDNESTCTSIGNFMRDILQDTEVPDTEARIIRQVIEEEADILDESLDSHWLQDDVSIATDFRLDFSFSPFSTPRSVSNDHCYTPKRPTDEPTDVNHYGILDNLIEKPQSIKLDTPNEIKDIDDILTDSLLDSNFGDRNYDDGKNVNGYGGVDKEYVITEQIASLTDDQINQVNIKNYYVDTIFDGQTITVPGFNDVDVRESQSGQCGIDRRLEEALKDSSNKDISLEALLGSPVYPNAAAPSTPTINNILFGERLDDENSQTRVGQTIEKFHNVQGDIDIFKEFLCDVQAKVDRTPPEVIQMETSRNIPLQPNDEDNQGTVKDIGKRAATKNIGCVCVICNRRFKNSRTLAMHSKKKHKVMMPKAKRKEQLVERICNYCGKKDTDKRNFIRHIKTHSEPKKVKVKCEVCGLMFITLARYKVHLMAHNGQTQVKPTLKVCCPECGKSILKTSMLKHMRIHQRNYLGHCEHCDKGYYTSSEYRDHLLEHTGERPYKCELCPSNYKRRGALIKHMKAHIGEHNYWCDNCPKRYADKRNLVAHIRNGRCKKKETGKNKKPTKATRRKNPNKVTVFEVYEDPASKPYQCIYCHKRHRTENLLMRHQKVSPACKEIQKQLAPEFIEILYAKGDNATLKDNLLAE